MRFLHSLGPTRIAKTHQLSLNTDKRPPFEGPTVLDFYITIKNESNHGGNKHKDRPSHEKEASPNFNRRTMSLMLNSSSSLSLSCRLCTCDVYDVCMELGEQRKRKRKDGFSKLIRTTRVHGDPERVDRSSRGSTISTVIYGEKVYRSRVSPSPDDLCAAANCRLSFVRAANTGPD